MLAPGLGQGLRYRQPSQGLALCGTGNLGEKPDSDQSYIHKKGYSHDRCCGWSAGDRGGGRRAGLLRMKKSPGYLEPFLKAIKIFWKQMGWVIQ